MTFLLNSQPQGVSGKNEQSTQIPWRGVPEARGPLQLHRLHRLKAGPGYISLVYPSLNESSTDDFLLSFGAENVYFDENVNSASFIS